MYLKRITLENFNNFEGKHSFEFDKINLIIGKNGSGKTTIGQEAILFCTHGYSERPLGELPTKWLKEKKCKVTTEFEDIKISREYPTSLYVEEDGVENTLTTSADKQNYLTKKFKNIEYFRKFRMLDVKKGINILEQGKTALLKTLFSFHENYFNDVRRSLLEKKRDRELYNKDRAVIYKHSPSMARFNYLDTSILAITEELYSLDKELSIVNQRLSQLHNQKGSVNNNLTTERAQKYKLLQNSRCPTCHRKTEERVKKDLLKQFNTTIVDLDEKMKSVMGSLEEETDLYSYLNKSKKDLQEKKARLSTLRQKLDARIKQKEYKWTDKDLLIMKKAIEEFDSFSNFYIIEWVKILEPLINQVINKIGYNVSFEQDAKGKLDIKLTKNGIEYSYRDLSSGQKLVLTVAFQLAILLEREEEGLIIADEGFSSLDADNLAHIFELFRQLPFQLICVIHRYDDVPEDINVIKLGD